MGQGKDVAATAGGAIGRVGRGVLVGAAAVGLAVGGAGVAAAASSPAHPAGALQARHPLDGRVGAEGPVIHGEWTVEHGGVFSTFVEQIGTAGTPAPSSSSSSSSSSGTSITVTSADNFPQTYTITSSTRVSPRGTTINPGNTLRVYATVPTPSTTGGSTTGGSTTADTAVSIVDVTAARAADGSHDHHHDGHHGRGSHTGR
jgi:hypothetical protein